MGETAWTLYWSKAKRSSYRGVQKQIHSAVALLQKAQVEQKLPALLELVPAVNSLTWILEPLHDEVDSTHQMILAIIKQEKEVALSSREVTLPVCFEGANMAPDKAALMKASGLSEKVLIEGLCRPVLQVLMLGFLPGFAYLGTLTDAPWAPPRLATPRLNVPARSVGLAAGMLGIYPTDSPGGWNLVGRTPLNIFNASFENPTFFRPGDSVSILPITSDDYYHLRRKPDAWQHWVK